MPTEGRRLPRHSDDFHVYQRYDGSPRSVDKPEPKRRRGQYIREEFHTEEHYIVTRTPLAGKQTEETRFPGRDQEHTEKGTQELKVSVCGDLIDCICANLMRRLNVKLIKLQILKHLSNHFDFRLRLRTRSHRQEKKRT